jgi:hypothetical protein
MILRLSFEEITALNSAAQRLLDAPGEGNVLAPPEAMAELESRLPLEGDISVRTLPEQLRLSGAVAMILDDLKVRMDAFVVEQYVGSEDAVNAYFDYANVLAAKARLADLRHEMVALAEVMTGGDPTQRLEGITFPD